jgi:hypothetical protein
VQCWRLVYRALAIVCFEMLLHQSSRWLTVASLLLGQARNCAIQCRASCLVDTGQDTPDQHSWFWHATAQMHSWAGCLLCGS